jgi:hypothetical protein
MDYLAGASQENGGQGRLRAMVKVATAQTMDQLTTAGTASGAKRL